MTLKPFGTGSQKTSESKSTSSRGKKTLLTHTSAGKKLKSFGSHPRSTGSGGRKPKLQGKPWNERLSYLVQRGYITCLDTGRGCWIICDRFSTVQEDEPEFDNPADAQKHADALNKVLFDLRLKELTGNG